ncbi:MAG: hypothetical protein QOJ54_1763 [Aliidongia sp.]|nr:hypothetical protein [Aliidongia sp.]
MSPLYGVPARHPVIPLYAVALQTAVAKNDRAELDSLICQAEAYLETYGDLPTLIELLKTEIARLER